jgi:hypothetical protein
MGHGTRLRTLPPHNSAVIVASSLNRVHRQQHEALFGLILAVMVTGSELTMLGTSSDPNTDLIRGVTSLLIPLIEHLDTAWTMQ